MLEGLNFSMTTMPTILLWVIGLVVFGLGAMLGYINMNIDARRKIEAAENKAEIIQADAEKKLAEAQLIKSQTPGFATQNLLRMHEDGNRIVIEMDGKSLSGALSASEKKRLLELISHVRPFIENAQVQTSISPKPVMTQQPLQPTLRPATPAVSEIKPVSMLGARQIPKKLDPENEFKLLSMVQQIDSVLQTKLQGSALENLGIRLQESLEGAVEVHIGTEVYDGIDSVPDEKVKAMIRAAITEWEEKHVPGDK